MKLLIHALAAAALALLPQSPSVDDATAKARLESALKATRLAHEPAPSGLGFQVLYEHREGRRQTVYVSAAPARPGTLLVHAVYTTVWVGGAEEPSEELLLRVLSMAKKLGSFYVHQDANGQWSIRFGAQFDATDLGAGPKRKIALVKRLRDTIAFVDAVGEEVDAAVNGEKDVR